MRALLVIVLVTGCDAVFLVDRPPVPDAAPDGAPLDAPPACPTAYAPIVGAPITSTYRVVPTGVPRWHFAFDDCRNDTPNGITHLVVFDDTAELAAIHDLMQVTPAITSAWVGYARDWGSPPFLFRSVLGGNVSATSPLWNDTEPNDGNGTSPETVVRIGRTELGMIDASYNDFADSYLCECDGVPTAGIDFTTEPP